MKIFAEVLSDYFDDETQEYALDGYFPGEESGVIVAWINKEGVVRLGDYAKPEYFFCELVQEHYRSILSNILEQDIIKKLSKRVV